MSGLREVRLSISENAWAIGERREGGRGSCGSRIVKKFSRRAKALRRAGRGMESTRFPVEFVCIRQYVSEEIVAADWSACRGRGGKVPRPDPCRRSSVASRHGSREGNQSARR